MDSGPPSLPTLSRCPSRDRSRPLPSGVPAKDMLVASLVDQTACGPEIEQLADGVDPDAPPDLEFGLRKGTCTLVRSNESFTSGQTARRGPVGPQAGVEGGYLLTLPMYPLPSAQ